MRNIRSHVLIVASALLIGMPIVADDIDTSQSVNRVSLGGRAELARLLSGKGRDEDKVKAIERLAELSKDLPGKENVAPSELFNPILGVLSNPRNKKSVLLRRTACTSLIAFARLKGSKSIVAPLGAILKNGDEGAGVRRAAAIALGRFGNDAQAATTELVAALTAELQNGPRNTNIVLAGELIDSLGRLKDKRSFVPLMRVISSPFPTRVKRRAQRALENIKWE